MLDPASPGDEQPPALPSSLAPQVAVGRRRWWIHLALIGAYPVLMAAISWGRAEARGPGLSRTASGLLLACGMELALFSMVFFLGWLASRVTPEALLLRWRPGWWVAPLGIGYSVAIRLVVGLVVVAVTAVVLFARLATPESLQQFMLANRPEVESLVDVGAMRSDPLYFWLTITLVSFVVAGLREELWRAAFLAALKELWPGAFASRRGLMVAVALVAVIFGVAHLGQGILAAGMAGLLGLMLGWIMVFHQSIWPAVIAHGMFDATSMALLPWAMERIQQSRLGA